MNKSIIVIFLVILLSTTILVATLNPHLHKAVKIIEPVVSSQSKPITQTEELAWNAWHSNILNTIIKKAQKAPDNQPYGTVNHIEFDVDANRNIINIKVYAEPEKYSQQAKNHFAPFIRELDGTDLLKFPDDTQRKVTHFKAGLEKSKTTKYSTASDFADYETIQK